MRRLATISKCESELTPELRDFLDRAIVPAIVEAYLADLAAAQAAESETPAPPVRAKPIEASPQSAAPPLDIA